MNYRLMNEMIDYIEENLTETISFQKLSKILGMNEFLMQRVFTFIVGISISEYIRKRRLSNAIEELKNTDKKIIDIALKYQYSSNVSFTRAFKKEYGITPKMYRKQETIYSAFPKVTFDSSTFQIEPFHYEVKEQDQIILWTKQVEADSIDNLHYKIRKLYQELKTSASYQFWNEVGMYATCNHQSKKYIYSVGSTMPIPDSIKLSLPKGKYLLFSVGSRSQKDIIKMNHKIYKKWIPSTNYNLKNAPTYEFYHQENCWIGIPIIS